MKKKIKSNFSDFFDNFVRVIRRPDMAILPGQLAFFYVLALVPTITLISYFASLLNLSTDVIYVFLENAFSTDVANLLLNTSSTSTTGISLIIIVLIGYYIASNGASSIIITSNTIYGVPDTGFFNRRLKAIVMTFFIVLLFIFLLIVPIFGKTIVDLVQYVNLNPKVTAKITQIFTLLRGPISWFIIYVFIKIVYTMAPNRRIKSKNVGYGAAFTSIGWIIATYIYSFYISHYANYAAFYGSLANLVILMLWFYFLAFIFTIGIALNYRKEEQELEKTGTIKTK